MRAPLGLLAGLLLALAPSALTAAPLPVAPVPLPDAAPGIGFDDLGFSPTLGKVLVPAARSGRLDLVDPTTLKIESIGGFSAQPGYDGGHDFGATSVDEAPGLLLVTDRTSQKLDLVDLKSRKIVSSTPLAAGPDYVRFVAPAEVWVSEPDHDQIELFHLQTGAHPKATHVGSIAVRGGPESLIIDTARGRAYSNLWKAKTVAIDLQRRAIVETWENGCKGSRGLALDGPRGYLFVACSEGTAVVLDAAHHGKQLSRKPTSDGVDVIAYSPRLAHLYVPGARGATLTILGVTAKGELAPLGTAPTAAHAHCVATDDAGRAFVCDPARGQLLLVRDPYPKTR